MTGPAAAAHWIPERLVDAHGTIGCRWLDIGDVRFTDPFFEDTLARRGRDRPARHVSPLQRLHDEALTVDALVPSAFVFHVSRCGSTLLSQLLGCDDRAIVLSEVPLLDELLGSTLRDREPLFAAALRLLGQRRFGEERLFVKTDCWHLLHAASLRRLYPDTPFILLYRSPDAVLDSHRRSRGMHMVPGLLARAPFTVDYDPVRMSLDQYAAAVLERYFAAMVDVATVDAQALLVNYEEGFPAAFERVCAWLDLPLDDRFRTRMHERLAYDGKNPTTPFSRPTAAVFPEVDLAPLRRLVDQLEALRQHSLP